MPCQLHLSGMGPEIVHNEHAPSRQGLGPNESNNLATAPDQELLPVDLTVVQQIVKRLIRAVQLILMLQIIAIS